MRFYGLILLLFNSLTFTTSKNTYENDFRYISYQDLHQSSDRFLNKNISWYSQLFFDVARNQVLVGARDALFRLSLPHLQLLENTTWLAPEEKRVLCIEKGQTEENCHNYIKVLLTDSKRIFTCGTNAFSPMCSWRGLDNISHVLEWVDGIAKCPYNPSANITTLMSENGNYFVGGPTDFHGSDAAIYRNFGQSIIRTKQYNSMWLNEPQFVGSFETDRFIYFFLREAAVEYINCGKIVYSRIARVCKDDRGGLLMLKDNWTTFLKARLNCSISGDYPAYFDEIQSVVYESQSQTVYATFTTPANSISGSAICAFNLTAIDLAFSGPFKAQDHTGASWHKQYPQNQDHFECKPSLGQNKYMLESSKYQLMDNAVQATALSPLYVAELERFTHITIDVTLTKLYNSMHVLYVATLDGLIKKLTVFPDNKKTCVVEIWQPTRGYNNPIMSLQYLKETDSVYVGIKTELLRITAHHCARHVSRESCLNAMDPYCGWNELDDACTSPPQGNPLTKHWYQNIISCPKLDASVDGGWGSWSDWAPCLHKSSNILDSTDECLCQTRQCNNPSVKNDGNPCVGLSIAVTNCTVHGDWTPWSAWSACSATCGIAVKTRRRTCSNPTPSHKGRVCVGQDRAEVLCAENPPCPVATVPPQDGQWGEWGDWTKCSVLCGSGYKKRLRKCDSPHPQYGGQECVGSDVEFEICNEQPCVEQKRHGPWTSWFLTNVSDGHTVERRYKYSCKGPVQDPSQLKIFVYKEEHRECTDGMCSSSNVDDAPKWTNWTPWTDCSVTCGEGVQIRSRMCKGRGECQGSPIQTKKCNLKDCEAEWSCWSDWTPCNAPCGLGVKQRTRACYKDKCQGESHQTESCQGRPCEFVLGWSEWSNWSPCDENNQQHRKRNCTMVNPGSNFCQGSNTETTVCVSEFSNDLSLELQANTASASAGTVVGCLICGMVIGILCSVGSIYFYFRKRKPSLPSSPHYITAKQNPYITVPLQDLPSRKQQGCSTSNSLLNNSHSGTIKSNKNNDYETATIKRNSHGLNNGHMKSDNYYYD